MQIQTVMQEGQDIKLSAIIGKEELEETLRMATMKSFAEMMDVLSKVAKAEIGEEIEIQFNKQNMLFKRIR